MVPRKKATRPVGELLKTGNYQLILRPDMVKQTLKQMCKSRAKAVTEAKSLLVGRFDEDHGGYIRDIWSVTSFIPFKNRTATNVYANNSDVADELLRGE